MTAQRVAAVDLAERGCLVFPLAPGGKLPLIPKAHRQGEPPCRGGCGRDGHGLHDATTDVERILEWWKRAPQANVGLRTGVRFDVLDVDVKDGAPGRETLARLQGDEEWPPGAVAGTPTGGTHFYVEPTGLGNRASFVPGLDWRGGGGYVVAPPSITSAGPYAWLTDVLEPAPCPPWLRRALTPTPYLPARGSRRLTVLPGGRYASSAVQGEVERLRRARVGTRNHELNRASFRLGQLIGAGVLDEGIAARALHAVALDIGLGEGEARATILSGLNAGVASPRHGVSA